MELTELLPGQLQWQRPMLLWLLLPGLFILLWQRWHNQRLNRWQQHIQPHLLQALSEQREAGKGPGASLLAAITLACWCLVLAGPQWSLDARSPGQSSALVISLDLSEALGDAELALAQISLTELLQQQRGNRVSLQVFAGSAHQVLPLTEDIDSLIWYLSHLTPALMPKPGWQPQAALTLGESQLADEADGRQLLLTVATPQRQPQLAGLTADHSVDVWLLGPVSEPMESASAVNLQPLIADAELPSFAPLWQFSRSQPKASAGAIAMRQRAEAMIDLGYWLVYPLALLCLLWFRRGVVLQW